MGIAGTAVIGIGNLLLRDEGAGVHAIGALGDGYTFPEGVSLVDGGTMGLDLLPYIDGRENVMLIDAVDFRREPGHIEIIEGGEMRAFLDIKFSVHQVGIPDLLFAAAFSGIKPARMCLVGIQPDLIEAGIELTDTLGGRMAALVDVIIDKLRTWGINATEREQCVWQYRLR